MSKLLNEVEAQFNEQFKKPTVIESTYSDDVDMLNVEMGDIRKEKQHEDQIMLDIGDDWNDSQWEGYYENNTRLINRLTVLEEYLHNLG